MLERSREERAAYVEDAAGGDAALRDAVAALLADADAATFFESPALEFAAPFLAELPPDRPADLDPAAAGSPIGPYRILREIGHGGMGTIYLAERADRQYEKTVALKLLRGWSAANEHLVRRFLEERQILAALDHPDIARLLDGGVTPDGLPWFAMEYVDGVPIDRYCDERRLSIESRLELFCRTCAAVQYAHRNLVVHRDLKPANILVTAEGGVKLLDFGIAKLLGTDAVDASASLTVTGERVMTLQYASPEQIRGDPITTACDVYALGVLLYELLTGRHPYRLATREPHDVARAILEQEPERPSDTVLRVGEASGGGAAAGDIAPAKLARRLRGDLDTIVLTAMQKDPARRYGTAEQLEADVRRHVAGLPVRARPDSRLYRTQKFIRRHRVGVTVAAGVTLLVVGFAFVTAVQSVRIRLQAARIAVERDRAEQVSGFLAGLFQTSDPYVGAGGGLTAREILDSGAARIDRELAGQPQARAQMLYEMGRAYFGLGLRDRARRFLEVSLAIRRRASPGGQIEIAQTLDFLGVVLLEQGELEGAERANREALGLRQQLLGARHRDVARTLNGLAAVLRAAGRFRDADPVSREAVAIDEAQPATHRLDLAENLKGLAQAVGERGDHAEAVRLYRQALALQRRELPADHPEAVGTLLDLAAALGDAGEEASADSLFRYGLALERRMLGDDHPDVAGNESRYARLLHRRGNDGEAETLYRRSLAAMRRRLPAVHPLTATTLLGLGVLLLDRGAADRPEPLLREALAMRRTALAPGHPGIAEAEQAMGAAIMAPGRYMEAERYLLTSRDGLRAAYGDADPRTRAALARLVALYDASAQPQQAAVYRAQLGERRPPRPNSGSNVERTLDTSAVAVLPFRIRDPDPALVDLRDFVQDLLAARLTGEGGPRALDPRVVLRALHGAGNSGDGDLPLETSLRVAEQLGTQWLLRGDVSGTTRRVSLDAMLVAVPGGVTLVRERVEGSADSLPYLADRLAARLLAVQAARDSDELGALSRTSLPALRAYLAGRAARHRGSSAALQHYERALSLDSTFAPAALDLVALGTLEGIRDEQWKFDAAWRLRERMTPPDRALLVAYLGPHYPRAATLAELIAAGEQATRVTPGRVDGWHIAGANLFRFGSVIGYPEWESKATRAFQRVLALDSTDAPTLEFLIQLAARVGDREAVRRYAESYLAHPTAERADQMRWLAGVVLGDSTGLAAMRRRFAETWYPNLMQIVQWSQQFGVGMEDGDRAGDAMRRRAATTVERTLVARRVVPQLLNRGRPGEAGRLLAASDGGFGTRYGVGVLEFRIYAALYWNGDSSEAAAAARQLEAYVAGGPGGLPEVWNRESASCALVHWRVDSGDLTGARTALRAMTRPPDVRAARPSPPSAPLCRATAEALLAAHAGDTGAPVALDRLDAQLRAGARPNDLLVPVGNLVAARLYEARGDLRRALEALRRRGGLNDLLSTQLREEGRLAALVGDREGAVRAYRHCLALRSAPEPSLREEAERVRAELARLEQGAGEPVLRNR